MVEDLSKLFLSRHSFHSGNGDPRRCSGVEQVPDNKDRYAYVPPEVVRVGGRGTWILWWVGMSSNTNLRTLLLADLPPLCDLGCADSVPVYWVVVFVLPSVVQPLDVVLLEVPLIILRATPLLRDSFGLSASRSYLITKAFVPPDL